MKDNNNNNNIVPIWQKYTLTVKETAEYTNIGENRLREMIKKDDSDSYILVVGNKTLIKREAFIKYLDSRDNV